MTTKELAKAINWSTSSVRKAGRQIGVEYQERKKYHYTKAEAINIAKAICGKMYVYVLKYIEEGYDY